MPQAEPIIKEKAWDKAFEPAICKLWKDKKLYRFDRKAKGTIFSIDTPPPYVNTPVHIGQVTTYVLMDMFARYHRMKGDRIIFPLGLDRNGLPIEMAAEKEFKKRLFDVSREEAIEMCRKVLEKASLASVDSFFRCGIGFNAWEAGPEPGGLYETDSPDYRSLTQETFIDMWEKGLIYEDNRINNWDPATRTTLADAEVYYKDLPATFNDIVFTCKETGEKLIIGTTRPELVCTCAMVIFNPEDARYHHLDGKHAVTPIFNKEVPIKAHPMAEIGKGTGLVMMCSAGDLSDIQFFREQKLTPVIAINADGTMNEHAGVLKGLKVKDARQKMIELCEEKDLLVGQKEITHRTPVSERSNVPIEFIAMPEFYVKQLDFKDDMRRLAKEMNFFEDSSRQILLDWIDSVSIDWPVSRRRFYATEVPLWYCKKCKQPILAPRGRYVQPWREPAPVKKCPKCGATEFTGETRVFDTWFDSSITPLYILKWRRDDAFFKEAAPCTVRPQGKEIVRTWLYYTVLKDFLLTGKCIFRDVWINYHIVDEKGHKMSKSTGNIIDPKGILDKFGAEPFRLWAAVEGNLTSTDFKCSEPRIDGAGKTLTKLWNVCRFASMFPKPGSEPKTLEPLDAWIRAELAAIVKDADQAYAKYDFHNPAIKLRHFVWETFASHYLELVKARAYNRDGVFSKEQQHSALATIHHCLEIMLRLFAPMTPLITYKLYESLTGKDIHFEKFPAAEKITAPFAKEPLEELDSLVWKVKKDAGKSLREPVKLLTIPKELALIEKELALMHGAQKTVLGEKAAVELA
jgi:valyl-tRNA synthetase